jgi:hypothetical protein
MLIVAQMTPYEKFIASCKASLHRNAHTHHDYNNGEINKNSNNLIGCQVIFIV